MTSDDWAHDLVLTSVVVQTPRIIPLRESTLRGEGDQNKVVVFSREQSFCFR